MTASLSLKNTGIIWLGLALFAILSIVVLLPIQPNDYWWYVRLGEDILTQRVIPTVDTYSAGQYGQPIVYHSWLSAVIFKLTHQWGGPPLTVLLRAVLLGLFYTLIWIVCRLAGAGPRLSALLIFVAALAGSNNWAMRPQLFSYPLFALALLCLWQWRLGKSRWVWVLPVIVVLWVNLHGAYVLCFLLAGAALVGGGGERKSLAMAFGLMLVAVLFNPRGVGAWSYVFTLLTDPSSQQLGAEWQPPTTAVWQGKLFFAWLLAFPLLTAFSKAKLSLTDWLWFLGFGWLALSGLRYVIWFLAVLPPLSALLLAPLVGHRFDRRVNKGTPLMNGLIFFLLIFLPLALLPGLREGWWAEAPPVLTATTPVEAVEWLNERPELPGPIWHDLDFASYLIYALPQRPVWIDTRFELYPPEEFERYVSITEAAPNWQNLLDAEGINLLLLNPAEQSRLVLALNESSIWEQVYEDDTAQIFVRSGGNN